MSAVIELLEERGIYYRMSGKDVLIRCINPDHEDTNPSLRVDKIMGVFHCFSCGHRGSLFKHYNVDYSETDIRREKLKRLISDLRSSGVGIPMPKGYTPYIGNWRGIKPETYKKFNAFRHHERDFLGRINFPITRPGGRIVGFQGRDEVGNLEDKYNFYPTGIKLPLFPSVSPLHGRVILVEGIFDMLNLHDKGLENAVCCFGVKNFNTEKLNYLKISGAVGLDLIFDADDAGTAAAEYVKKIAEGFPVRVVTLKSGDPGDLSEKQVMGLRRKLYG